ncbi:hypothetical protein GT360_19550 [Vibrio astriarenae]|uniref:Uncharacterized protein n=1 Tax=Vibrio astriarenae TaxID=1481923 RepID=A0A7Z2YFQ1_9VIBR|nr:hypothetical protein [Vibrio astriarenae]QIA65718.1 hypothetical protein GT360_19550 [Vibrio astriarenae]
MINKVVFVEAKFKPVGKINTIMVPSGEKKKGLFGGEKDIMTEERSWEQTGWSDCEIDGGKLSEDLQNAIMSLNKEGYEVISVTPVTSAKYKYDWDQQKGRRDYGGSGYGYGYGYSYTEGLTIVAKKIS